MRHKLNLLTGLLIIAAVFFIPISQVFAADADITLPTINLTEGESAVIEAQVICNVGSCDGMDVTIAVDPAVLQIDSIAAGTLLGSTGNTIFPIANTVDAAAGTANLAVTTLNDGNAPVTGSGVLFTVNVTALAEGSSSITISNILMSSLLGAPVGTSSIPGTATVSAAAPDPAILAQPAAVTVDEPNAATFSVSATGTNITYQWEAFDGAAWNAIGGATAASYTLDPTSLADSGSQFRVVVTGDNGSLTSDPATLTVNPIVVPDPNVVTQPADVTVQEPNAATFSVSATGTNITYQWEAFDGAAWNAIGGATADSYTLDPTSLADSGSQFRVVVTGDNGSLTSDPATLTVTEDVVITDFRCYVDAPTDVNTGDVFAADLKCDNVPAPGAFGLNVCYTISGVTVTAQDGNGNTLDGVEHAAGNVFDGYDVLSLDNTLTDTGGCYGLAIQDGTGTVEGVSGNFSIATANFLAMQPGTMTITIDTMQIGNRTSVPMPPTQIDNAIVTITGVTLTSLEGDIQREAGNSLSSAVTVNGQTLTTLTANGDYGHFLFDGTLPVGDTTMSASATGHLSCESNVTLVEGANTLPSVVALVAGDVNMDGAISLADAAAVSAAARAGGTPVSGEDLDESGVVDIFDLIYVGNNYDKTAPQPCLP